MIRVASENVLTNVTINKTCHWLGGVILTKIRNKLDQTGLAWLWAIVPIPSPGSGFKGWVMVSHKIVTRI